MVAEVLPLLFERGCVKFEYGRTRQFKRYKAPGVYCDGRRAMTHRDIRSRVIAILLDHLSELSVEPQAVVAVERGGVPWAAIIAYMANVPYLSVRSEIKPHGDESHFAGDPAMVHALPVAFIEDTITGGGSAFAAYDTLRSQVGCQVIEITSLFNYQLAEASVGALKRGVTISSIFMFEDLVEYARQTALIDADYYDLLLNWQENPRDDRWASDWS